jgi:hypothetical protein
MIQLVWQIMMATGLAASAGLRAFLPLLVIGLAGRFELIPLGASFEWMASTPALTVLGAAVALEVIADKIPVVDHALDVVGTFTRPVAGAIAAASPLTALDPLAAAVVGVIVGGGISTGIHVAKSTLRLGSTGATGGLANPLVSVGEDAVSLAGALASLVVPFVTFTLVVGTLYLLVAFRSRRAPPSERR